MSGATHAVPLAGRLFELLIEAQDSAAGYRGFVSGAQLAAQLGVTRGAVWKAATQLRELGLGLQALPRQGYRLSVPCTALHRAAVLAALDAGTAAALRQGDCVWSIGSTNAALLARGGLAPGQFDFLTAEVQTAGRGRRGRRWLAPPGGAVCLSWSWRFEVLPAQAGALSLVIGLAARRALQQLGIEGVQIKWPNDLVCAQGKLGGILIELRAEAGGPTQVVIGIGLNLHLDAALTAAVAAEGNRAAGLSVLGAAMPERSALVAALLSAGVQGLQQFASEGFAPFHSDYAQADALRGLAVTASGGAVALHGVASGVDADGALLIRTDAGLQRVLSGDVSIRPQSQEPGA